MGNLIVVEAGRAGGDIDGFIALMGRPIEFGYGSHKPGHVTMVEGRGDTGMSIELVWVEQVVVEVRLHGADGRVLVDITSMNRGYFLTDPKTGADATLDSMMDDVQSGSTFGFANSYEFIGNVGADRFTGGQAGDVLRGGAGNDTLAGGGGADTLAGGWGDDALNGGNGADRMRGNAGADQFVFGSASAAQGDVIVDFDGAVDRLDLRLVGDGTAMTFIGTGAFDHQAGQLRMQVGATRTVVQGDIDGDGQADFAIVLLGAGVLDAAALMVV